MTADGQKKVELITLVVIFNFKSDFAKTFNVICMK